MRMDLTDSGNPSGEWRLHNAKFSLACFGETNIPFRVVTEFVSRSIESRVFIVFAFNGARFTAAGPLRHLVAGQSRQEPLPKLPAFGFRARPYHGVRKLPHGIEAAFEAQALHWHMVIKCGLRHGAAKQIVCD